MAYPFLARSRFSLTFRLLRALAAPLAVVALLLGVGGALVIAHSVETLNDRILGAASRAIADSLSVEGGDVALNLSPAIFGMLEDTERDNVYYSVRHRGVTLTGYSDMPDIAPRGLADTQVIFGMARYRGRDIRIAAEGRRVSGIADPLVVEVAETMDQRRAASARMLEALAALEVVLLAMMAIFMPLAVRWGLRPVREVGRDMDQRSAVAFTPLATEKVPGELQDLVRAFNGLLARLDANMQGMRRFTADASHQMRTPLSILRTHIALLRKATPGSDDARMSIDDIDHASARLQRLLVQLLALARADNAVSAPVLRDCVDLNHHVQDLAAGHAPQAVAHGIDLHFHPAPSPALVNTQEVLLDELLSNLIDNAIRYGRQNGNLEIIIESSLDQHVIHIEDDGPGIPPEDREHVFERFTRLRRDEHQTGSGLGLPIALMMADAIGAKLTLSTAPGNIGLRASVSLPALSVS